MSQTWFQSPLMMLPYVTHSGVESGLLCCESDSQWNAFKAPPWLAPEQSDVIPFSERLPASNFSKTQLCYEHPTVDAFVENNPWVTWKQPDDLVFKVFNGLGQNVSKYEMGFINNLCAFFAGVGVRFVMDESAKMFAGVAHAFHPEKITDWWTPLFQNFGLHMLAVAVIGVFFVGASGYRNNLVLRTIEKISQETLGEKNVVTQNITGLKNFLDSRTEISPDDIKVVRDHLVLLSNGLLGYFRKPSLKAAQPDMREAQPIRGLSAFHDLMAVSRFETVRLFSRAVPENLGKAQSFFRDFIFNSAASLVLAKCFSLIGDTHMPPVEAFMYSMFMTSLVVTGNRIVGEDKKLSDTTVNAVRTAYAIASGAMIKGVAAAQGVPVEFKLGVILMAGMLIISHAISISTLSQKESEGII